MKKQLAALLLVFAFVFAASPAASAASTAKIQSANTLYTLGLFQGTGTNPDGTPLFQLDAPATREQAVVILLRLLGKEKEALAGAWPTPFTDNNGWSQQYIAYAYTMGYTKGISSTEFGGKNAIGANEFYTLILRALGYSDAEFSYSSAAEFADSIGLSSSVEDVEFTRGDIAEISLSALKQPLHSASYTLLQSLFTSGVLTRSQIESAGLSAYLSTSSGGTAKTAEEIYADCSPAVFSIAVYDSSGNLLQTGSGFFLSSDGTAATNYHVIEGGASAKITLASNGSVHTVAGIYDYDISRDIALLKITGNGFPALSIGDSDMVAGGATVYAIGSPLGLSNTISQGIISSASRTINGQTYLQTTAPISSGSSGGALLDTSGAVIGITSATLTDGQNLNLAIPINAISTLSTASYQPIAERLTAAASLSASSCSVSLQQGGTASLSIAYSPNNSVSLRGTIEHSGIVTAQLIKDSSSTAILRCYALSPGTTQITLFLYDAASAVLASQTIAVTVT